LNSPGVPDLLEKAERSVSAAEGLLADGFPDFAAARSYYAMFYATEALLLSRDQSFSKHSAVIAAFGREFVKPGLLPQSLHRDLLEAYDLRNLGDYGAPLGDYGAPHAIDHAVAAQALEKQRPSMRPLETS